MSLMMILANKYSHFLSYYSYAILASEVLKSLHMSGLDPYAGFLHADLYGRTSLVFDVMEEFRQQIVDKSVLKLINLGQIQKKMILN